jgi:hypothetical protein
MAPDDVTLITSKDLKIALRKAKGNSKELIEAEVNYGDSNKSIGSTRRN